MKKQTGKTVGNDYEKKEFIENMIEKQKSRYIKKRNNDELVVKSVKIPDTQYKKQHYKDDIPKPSKSSRRINDVELGHGYVKKEAEILNKDDDKKVINETLNEMITKIEAKENKKEANKKVKDNFKKISKSLVEHSKEEKNGIL